MNMITTCPKCNAAFRVSSEQLSAREGKVRCGRCAHVFNGFMTLETPADDLPEPFAAEVQDDSPPIEIIHDMGLPEKTHALAPQVALELPPAPFILPPAENILPDSFLAKPPEAEVRNMNSSLASEALAVAPGVKPTPADTKHLFNEEAFERNPFDDEPFADQSPSFSPTPASGKDFPPATSWSPAGAPESTMVVNPTGDGSKAPRKKSKAERKAEKNKSVYAASVDTDTHDPLLDYFEDDDAHTGPTLLDDVAEKKLARPHRAWAFGSALLLISLATQALYSFRTEVAQAVPAARPLMEQACASLNCSVPLPQHFDLLSIEASDLVADPQKPDQIELRATLRNRAQYVQAFPQLDLTLTDAQDQTLVKRIIAPGTYLIPPADNSKGFAPNSEISIKLPFNAASLKPAGYRLLLFYP